jgi:hypothetical protein
MQRISDLGLSLVSANPWMRGTSVEVPGGVVAGVSRRPQLNDHKEHFVSTLTDTTLGTHSEVGRLRTVMMHRPDLAHESLSPSNAQELLFNDVIWVRRARQEFDAFVDLMRSAGGGAALHELLAKTLEDAEARMALSRRVRRGRAVAVRNTAQWLGEMPAVKSPRG